MAYMKLRHQGRMRLPVEILHALKWQAGDRLWVEQPRDDSDYIIIHKAVLPTPHHSTPTRSKGDTQ